MDPIFIRLTDGFVCALRATVADGRPLISMTNCHGMEHVTVPTIEANITLLNSLMDVLENTDMPLPRLGQLQNMIQEADGADKILSRLPKQVNVSMHQAWCKAEAHKLIDVWQCSCRSLWRARGPNKNGKCAWTTFFSAFVPRVHLTRRACGPRCFRSTRPWSCRREQASMALRHYWLSRTPRSIHRLRRSQPDIINLLRKI